MLELPPATRLDALSILLEPLLSSLLLCNPELPVWLDSESLTRAEEVLLSLIPSLLELPLTRCTSALTADARDTDPSTLPETYLELLDLPLLVK